jgi:hypothetical protein
MTWKTYPDDVGVLGPYRCHQRRFIIAVLRMTLFLILAYFI